MRRVRFVRTVVALALVALVGATFGARAASVQAQAPEGSYESPNYAVSLNWDGTWTLLEEETGEDDQGDPLDTLTLAHESSRDEGSVAVFIARRGTVDALECVDVVAESLSDLAEVSDFRQAEADGEPIGGGDESYAYGAYTLTWEIEGEATAAAALICISITPGEELLIIQQLIFPEAAFNDEVQALAELIDGGLEVSGRGGGGAGDQSSRDGGTGNGDSGGPPAGNDGPPGGATGLPDEEEGQERRLGGHGDSGLVREGTI